MQVDIFNKVSFENSKQITKAYSNSFALAIKLLAPSLRNCIYSIYGFVRLADEIVDSFHQYNKEKLLNELERDVYTAIEEGISSNPVLNSFQLTVRKYNIDLQLIDAFLKSMRKDLNKSIYNKDEYMEYIFGSADVVGLMCLKVFVEGNEDEYVRLKEPAMKLGSAFQKVNFLRDIKNDYENLNRKYFPDIDLKNFTNNDKQKIITEIRNDFKEAYNGITKLPLNCRLGVYTAYIYYKRLMKKIEQTPASEILNRRISVPNYQKLSLIVYSYFKLKLGLL